MTGRQGGLRPSVSQGPGWRSASRQEKWNICFWGRSTGCRRDGWGELVPWGSPDTRQGALSFLWAAGRQQNFYQGSAEMEAGFTQRPLQAGVEEGGPGEGKGG